jgi:hypothetical protein
VGRGTWLGKGVDGGDGGLCELGSLELGGGTLYELCEQERHTTMAHEVRASQGGGSLNDVHHTGDGLGGYGGGMLNDVGTA